MQEPYGEAVAPRAKPPAPRPQPPARPGGASPRANQKSNFLSVTSAAIASTVQEIINLIFPERSPEGIGSQPAQTTLQPTP